MTGDETPTRPSLGLTAAAEACRVSPRTIRRYVQGGKFPNATKDETGRWAIPVTDLLAAGLHPGAPTPPEPVTPTVDSDELTRWRERALVAEAKAELLAESVDDLRRALRALTPPETESATATPSPAAPIASPATSPARRRWWQR